MAKKSTAVEKKVEAFMVLDDKGNFKSLTDSFINEVKEFASDIGKLFLSIEEKAKRKAKLALNVTIAYDAWSAVTTKSSVPKFVKTWFVPTLPDSYGKPGSEERKQLTTNSTFNGLEKMIAEGHKAMKAQKDRQKLIDAGIDPENTEEVSAHSKETRENRAEEFQANFTKCFLEIMKHGITQTTIENFVVRILKKKDKETDGISKAGRDIALNTWTAILAASGKKVEAAVKEQSDMVQKSELLESLKKAKGNNAKIQKIVSGQKPKAATK